MNRTDVPENDPWWAVIIFSIIVVGLFLYVFTPLGVWEVGP